jgi:hypothetical protein
MTKADEIRAAIGLAGQGVDYAKRGGAKCPACGKKMPVLSSPKFEGGAKERYHKCRNEQCAICVLCLMIKSVEAE